MSHTREEFLAGCWRLIDLDGCFLKGLLKGQLLMVVGKEANNKMFLLAWAIVGTETSERWTCFIELLRSDFCMRDGLGWEVVSDMQKVCESSL